jgi:hypothetical protein
VVRPVDRREAVVGDQQRPVETLARQRRLDHERLVVVDLVGAVVVDLVRHAADRLDLLRARQHVDAVVVAVPAREIDVEADHALGPGAEVRDASIDLGVRRRRGVVEALDRDAGVDLLDPVDRALAHQEPHGRGLERPPIAGVSGRSLGAEDHAERTLLAEAELVEAVLHRRDGGRAFVAQQLVALLTDLDEAVGAPEAADAVGALRIDVGRAVGVVGAGAAHVHRDVPAGRPGRPPRVERDVREIAVGDGREREAEEVAAIVRRGIRAAPAVDQLIADRREVAQQGGPFGHLEAGGAHDLGLSRPAAASRTRSG